MKDKHESELLNKYLNKQVRIIFKDGKVKSGYLCISQFGFGYYLQMPEGNIHFAKSLVKKISLLWGGKWRLAFVKIANIAKRKVGHLIASQRVIMQLEFHTLIVFVNFTNLDV